MFINQATAKNRSIDTIKRSIIAFLLALIISAFIILAMGYSPLEAYKAIFVSSLGSKKGLVLSLSQATPMIFTGLSFSLAYRVRMINTGIEGQLCVGAMGGALVGAYITNLPKAIHTPLALLTGALLGGLVGLFIAFLRVKFQAGEVITSLMMNEILILFCSYLAIGPFREVESAIPQTPMILDTAKLSKLVQKSQLTTSLIIVLLLSVVVYLIMIRTTFGYEMEVSGYNTQAAVTAGIKINKIYRITFAVSGAIAGLCGATLAQGVNYRFVEGISSKYGFAGISVAALAAYHPIGVIASALLFGILKAGAITLNRTTMIPIEIVDVIQVLVVVFIAGPKLIDQILSLFRHNKKTSTIQQGG